MYVQVAFIATFHSLMSWWKRWSCSSLTEPRFSGKESKWLLRKQTLILIMHPQFWKLNSNFATNSLLLSVFLLARKSLITFVKAIQALASIGFIEVTKLISRKSCLIGGHRTHHSFYFQYLDQKIQSKCSQSTVLIYQALLKTVSLTPILVAKNISAWACITLQWCYIFPRLNLLGNKIVHLFD